MTKPITPEPILRMLNGLWLTQTVAVAVELDVFTRVAKRVNTVKKVAAVVGTATRPIEMLLDALVALDLLTKRGEEYQNTAVSEAFLVKGSPKYYGDFVAMNAKRTYVTWGTLKESILANKAQAESLEKLFERDPDFAVLFTRAMHNNAIAPASALVSVIDFSSTKRFLDIGGGSGIYSILLAKQYPGIEAVVYDFASVCSVAQEYIDQFGVSAQVRTMSGNIFKDDLPSRIDDVLIAQVLHSYPPEKCVQILETVSTVLEQSGRVLIVDFFLNDDKTSPLYSTLFALNMLVGSPGGNAYSYSEVREFLRATGFRNSEIKDLPGPASLIIAKKC